MGTRGPDSGMKGMSNEQRKDEKELKKLEGEKYTEFDDVPRSGFEYEGDGWEQETFFEFNSNVNRLISQMTDDEIRQWSRVWVPGAFMMGEGYKDWDKMDDWAQSAIRTYDKYLDRATLDEGVVVSRLATAELLFGKGNKHATLDQIKAMRGQTVVSIGNMSTGAAKEGLTIGSRTTTKPGLRGKCMEYRIHIPGGTVGAGMWICNSKLNPGFGNDQREFMTNRDIRLKVGNARHDKRRDVFVVDLYYDGRLEHRYK